jgi:hypothetical protein
VPEPVRVPHDQCGFSPDQRRVGFHLPRSIACLEDDWCAGSQLAKQPKTVSTVRVHDSVVKDEQMKVARPERFTSFVEPLHLNQDKGPLVAAFQYRPQTSPLGLLTYEQDSQRPSGRLFSSKIWHSANAPFLAREQEQVVKACGASSTGSALHKAHFPDGVDCHTAHTARGGRGSQRDSHLVLSRPEAHGLTIQWTAPAFQLAQHPALLAARTKTLSLWHHGYIDVLELRRAVHSRVPSPLQLRVSAK